MSESFIAHVGGRIRLFRKSRGMTLDELAEKVQKSKATLSKYETGAVIADIETVYRIAEALGVQIGNLLDYPITGTAGHGKSPFGDAGTLFAYHYSSGTVHISELHLFQSDGTVRATLYYKMTGPQGSGQCRCIYNGSMYYHDIVVAFVLQNYHNPVENVLMNINIPLDRSDVMQGMICGLSSNTMAPTALKVLLSERPLTVDEPLRNALSIPAEAFREMRRKNTLFIPLD